MNNTVVQSVKMSSDLKNHIKEVAEPNVNAWIVAKLKKASSYKEKK